MLLRDTDRAWTGSSLLTRAGLRNRVPNRRGADGAFGVVYTIYVRIWKDVETDAGGCGISPAWVVVCATTGGDGARFCVGDVENALAFAIRVEEEVGPPNAHEITNARSNAGCWRWETSYFSSFSEWRELEVRCSDLPVLLGLGFGMASTTPTATERRDKIKNLMIKN